MQLIFELNMPHAHARFQVRVSVDRPTFKADNEQEETAIKMLMSENKGADHLCSKCTSDQRLCHATQIVQSIFFFSLKQASSHLLRLYRPVCAGPSRNPRSLVFLRKA